MRRHLDLSSLRSFVAIVDAGGVTRAAGFLNLTQSAVSMQIKRLEDQLGLQLLERQGRKVALTGAGEQLLGYARKLLSMNDEVFGRMTRAAYEGEIVLGVPHDIVYPAIPQVLQQFARDFPRMKVTLVSSFSRKLLEQFARGDCDIILTTEDRPGPEGESLHEVPLVWIGAPGGQAWRGRPLRLAFPIACIFRGQAQSALDDAGIPWEMAVESEDTRAVEATVSADLAIYTSIAGSEPPYVERIAHGGELPELGMVKINIYVSETSQEPALLALAALLRQSYRTTAPRLLAAG